MIWAKLVGINEGLKLNIKFGAGLREYFLCFIIDFLGVGWQMQRRLNLKPLTAKTSQKIIFI